MSGSIFLPAKQAAAFLIYRSGLLHLWIRWKIGKRPLVVMYHRVLDSGRTDYSQDGIVLQVGTFEKQLLQLRRMFSIVSLEAAMKPAGGGTCVITFDDGWADNHGIAFPVLKRLGLPATLFITTGYIGTRKLFWPERMAFLMQDRKPGEMDLDSLIESLKDVTEEVREDFLEQLVQSGEHDPASLKTRMLDWDQVRDLRRQGFEIGSHTVNHVLLNRVDSPEVDRELDQSRNAIAAQLGESPRSFAYPNGNWNPDIAASVQKAGYRMAVTTESPWRIPMGVNPDYAIPRKNLCEGSSKGVSGFSASIFACEATGFFDWCKGSWKNR